MDFIFSLSASTFAPCILLLHSVHALGKDKERNVEGIKKAFDIEMHLF